MQEFTIKEVPSFQVDIYIAGNKYTIEESCARFCDRGACVSITPQKFVYTAGRESGAKITVLAYARFPKTDEELTEEAFDLAKKLLVDCSQHSCSVVQSTGKSFFLSRKLDNMKAK